MVQNGLGKAAPQYAAITMLARCMEHAALFSACAGMGFAS